VRGAFVKNTVGRAYQANFLYPKSGGAGAIPTAVAHTVEKDIRTEISGTQDIFVTESETVILNKLIVTSKIKRCTMPKTKGRRVPRGARN